MRKSFYILLIATIVLGLFYVYGRNSWHPVYVKLRGGKSVNEVVREIKKSGRFVHDFDEWQSLRLLCFKQEKKVEVWASGAFGTKKIKEFNFTGYSGDLGPKLKQGDGQIPEGVYGIDYLNPNSRYHLSLKISYPNTFDREKGRLDGRQKLGYDIFFHGKSATIGCIPIGDAGIEELFLMVSEVGKDKVEVIISPYDMRSGKREIDITDISWENELYQIIYKALMETSPNQARDEMF